MRKKKYKNGSLELLALFENTDFNRIRAEEIIAEIEDINEPILNKGGYSTTYLYEAQENNNVEAVRFLFENGADPNFCDTDLFGDCALWDLQFFKSYDYENELSARYEISKLFFEYGADPNHKRGEDEPLYDYVIYEAANEGPDSHWEHWCRFLVLMAAYGGGGLDGWHNKPELTEPIDKSRIDEYDICFELCEDGYHIKIYLVNPEGEIIGRI